MLKRGNSKWKQMEWDAVPSVTCRDTPLISGTKQNEPFSVLLLLRGSSSSGVSVESVCSWSAILAMSGACARMICCLALVDSASSASVRSESKMLSKSQSEGRVGARPGCAL